MGGGNEYEEHIKEIRFIGVQIDALQWPCPDFQLFLMAIKLFLKTKRGRIPVFSHSGPKLKLK